MSFPTCFCLHIPSSDPSHCFLTQSMYSEIWAQQEKQELFLWCLLTPARIKLFKDLCRGNGTKRSLAKREKDADWCNVTCFSFFWPWCLLRREIKISRRTQGRSKDLVSRHALVGEESRKETWTGCYFLPFQRKNSISSVADWAFSYASPVRDCCSRASLGNSFLCKEIFPEVFPLESLYRVKTV